MSRRTFSTDRVPLPPGFRMFILPEYRLVTPTYSVRLSRSHGMLVAALLANYERQVLRSDVVASLWGHLENGGPEGASSTVSVMLVQIKTKLRSVGIDVTVKANWWHGRDSALKASGLRECTPVGCPNNPTRLQALRDKQSPNPARGLPKIKPEEAPAPPPKQKPRPNKDQIRENQLRSNPRYSYVEQERPPGIWTHNARAEASFGNRGPT